MGRGCQQEIQASVSAELLDAVCFLSPSSLLIELLNNEKTGIKGMKTGKMAVLAQTAIPVHRSAEVIA